MECLQRLQIIRENMGYSQEKVAEDLKVSYSTYKKIENGESTLMTKHLCRLNEAYGTSSDYILYGEEGSEDETILQFITNCSERDKMRILLYLSRIKKKRQRGKDEKNTYT